MDRMKVGLLDEVIQHLQGMQGSELKELLDQIKSEEMSKDMGEEGKPHGIAIEKVEMIPKHEGEKMGAMPGMDGEDLDKDHGCDEEMSDDELNEMLGKFLK